MPSALSCPSVLLSAKLHLEEFSLNFVFGTFSRICQKYSKTWSKLRNIGHLYEDVSTFIFLTTTASTLELDKIANRSWSCLYVVTFNGYIFIIYNCLSYLASSSFCLWQLLGILFCCYLVDWCLIKLVWKVLTSGWEMPSDKLISDCCLINPVWDVLTSGWEMPSVRLLKHVTCFFKY